MSFSIQPQKNIPMEEMRAKIEQPVLEELKRYAEFYQSSIHYAVQEVLRNAFAHDKKFQASLHPETGGAEKKTRKNRTQSGPRPVDKTAVA